MITKHIILLLTSFVLLLITTCPFVFCVEPQLTQNVSLPFQLKLCGNHSITMEGESENQITIPTFSISGNSYVLRKLIVDETNIMTVCPNGNSPIGLVTVVKKESFDKNEIMVADNFTVNTLYPFLRSNNLLYQSGYLSVGSNGTATYYSASEFCVFKNSGQGDAITVDFKMCELADSRPILRKCCPLGMAFGPRNRCSENRNSYKWDPGYMDPTSLTILPVEKVNPVFTWEKFSCQKEKDTYPDSLVEEGCAIKFHPVIGNRYAFLGAYRTWEFSNISKSWCMDSVQREGEPDRLMMLQCSMQKVKKKNDKSRISTLYMINMYAGSVFHFMTALVYLITWKKQNIHGRTLYFCASSLFFMQVTLGTSHLLGKVMNTKNPICITNAIAGQYFMIAAFTWLVVVNFDLWNTFGSIRSEGGKGVKRLLMYAVLGWGFPAIVTSISVALDFTFTCRTSRVPVPEFGEHYCFVTPWAQGYYLYYILGLLIAVSYVLSFLTWFGLYNLKKDNANLRSTKSADDKQKYLLYLKLSVLMGLTWIFEVISWAATKENENLVVWIILDFYNALSAILIFVFFVCKKSTLSLLEQSMPCIRRFYNMASVLRLQLSFSRSGDQQTTTTTRTDSK